MQPVVFSVKEAMSGHPFWFRAGGRVKYYKNYFLRNGSTASKFLTFPRENSLGPSTYYYYNNSSIRI